MKRLSSSIRANVITGTLVLAPIGAVLWIVLWLWGLMMSVSDLLPDGLQPRALLGLENPMAIRSLDFVATILVLVLIVFFVWLVGLVSRNYLGRRLLEAISHFVGRVPVLSTVYSTLEQLLKTFAAGQSKNFRRAVQIEYPRKGLYALAFVTGERDTDPATGRRARFLNVYVPTTPNPTSGFYLTVSNDEVKEVDMTVEEALTEIISMGIVHKQG